MPEVHCTAQGDEARQPNVQPSTQQQQQQLADGNQLLQLNISKAFNASGIINKAESSRLYAIVAIAEDPRENWRQPQQFSVSVEKDGTIQEIDIEQYLSDIEVECGPKKGPKIRIPAAAFLSSADTDVWQAIHLVYGRCCSRKQ
jgi:hypothetical protein